MENLKNKTVLVTGGGQGLGEQICRVLGEAGMRVIVADIAEENASKVAKSVGNNSFGCRLDVANEDSVKEVINKIVKECGQIDVLINNAGIDVTKNIEELSVAEFERVQRVNVTGPFTMCKYLLPHFYEKKQGHIINVISTSGLRGWQPSAGAYAASKFGLRGLTQVLFTEAREHNVKVSAIIAGGMRTPFILERFPDTPLDKLQDPKNVAETIKYVLSVSEGSVVPEVMIIPQKEVAYP